MKNIPNLTYHQQQLVQSTVEIALTGGAILILCAFAGLCWRVINFVAGV